MQTIWTSKITVVVLQKGKIQASCLIQSACGLFSGNKKITMSH